MKEIGSEMHLDAATVSQVLKYIYSLPLPKKYKCLHCKKEYRKRDGHQKICSRCLILFYAPHDKKAELVKQFDKHQQEINKLKGK